ncbi:GntR family transcriptional regulator [Nocardioides sp. SYSU D00065]|uniref:GntR family transcriptional regulator n=1 Tax=Nocardioides sp. SYSU D00065 TaxID=2817378 RepID=UPI001B3429C9|nr:GntR family transcriptional regulator [Nocardioides sp. SYSU D00065]
MGTGIDRTSPLPFYYQLKELLAAEIRHSALPAGSRLPGDRELCETYGLSRTVVRQALSELELEGLIERIKGRGTFVASPKTAEGLVQSLTGLYEDVAARGGHLRSVVHRLDLVPASDPISRDLDLAPGTPVIAIERLRLVDDKPWVYTITHLPYDLAPGLLNEDLSEQSLYRLLEDEYQVRLARGRRSVEASTANLHLSEELGIPVGAPVLVLRSISVDERDRPVETFVAFHRGDSSRFEVELGRSGAEPVRPLMRLTRGSTVPTT